MIAIFIKWANHRQKRALAKERAAYRAAMMAAITLAAGAASKTNGLRVIRNFERVNECAFDPHSDYHLEKVTKKGWIEEFDFFQRHGHSGRAIARFEKRINARLPFYKIKRHGDAFWVLYNAGGV